MPTLAVLGEFPDVELLVRLYLQQVTLSGTPVTVVDEPRNPLDPPVITAMQLPGQGVRPRRPWEATRRIETASMGVSRADSRAMNTQIEQLMLGLAGSGYRGVLIDRVTQNTGPGQVPYAPDVRRIPIVWDLTMRPHQGAAVTT